MNKPWLCEKCGQHMVWHGMTPPPGRKPICPEKMPAGGDGEQASDGQSTPGKS